MIPKFRARDERGNWHVGLLTFMFGQYAIVNEADENTVYLIDKETVGQSTGLKDLNGVEIFEGDIVSVRNHPFQKTESSVGIEIDGDYKVSWNEYDLTWCAGNLLLARIKPYVTVIGNVYEDGDLLNDSEDTKRN